jgi:PBP1b-binding outer membrane lipoprotein LpoB
MKKIISIFFAVLALSFAACKKDRTCSCTVTKTGTVTTTASFTFSVAIPLPIPPIGIDTTFSSPVNESYSTEIKMEDVKKRTAKQNCYSYKEPYQETTYNIVPSFTLTSVNSGNKSYSCELK